MPASFLKTFAASVPDVRTGLGGTAYCGVCGYLVADEKHCGHCGVGMSPIEDEERAVAKRFGCPTCGRAVEPEGRFCEVCGTDLGTERKGQ